MPINIEMLPNEPIIIVKLEGRITADDVVNVINECAQLTMNVNETIYRITDVTDAEIAITDMMPIVAAITAEGPASVHDPRYYGIFVGKAKTSRLYTDIIRKQALNGEGLPFFYSVDDALDFVQGQRARVTA